MTDLAELFARDPRDLSDQDIDTIVAEMRKNRDRFKAGVSPTKAKQTKAQDIDLKGLGL